MDANVIRLGPPNIYIYRRSIIVSARTRIFLTTECLLHFIYIVNGIMNINAIIIIIIIIIQYILYYYYKASMRINPEKLFI